MIILDILAWWREFPVFEQIFWALALVFTFLFILQTILSFVSGGDGESMGDAEMAVEGDEGIGFGFLTIKNFIAFFAVFGWTGVALSRANVPKGITIVVSLAAGMLVVAMMMYFFRSMSKLRASGTLIMKNAIGIIAETYLLIPARRGGFGKVHIKVQGSLHELQAITDDEDTIPTGKLVKVTDVVNDSVLLVTSKF